MPITTVNFNKNTTNPKINGVSVVHQYLTFKGKTLLSQPFRHFIFEFANYWKFPLELHKFFEHFRSAFVSAIPFMITIVVAKASHVFFNPTIKFFNQFSAIVAREYLRSFKLALAALNGRHPQTFPGAVVSHLHTTGPNRINFFARSTSYLYLIFGPGLWNTHFSQTTSAPCFISTSRRTGEMGAGSIEQAGKFIATNFTNPLFGKSTFVEIIKTLFGAKFRPFFTRFDCFKFFSTVKTLFDNTTTRPKTLPRAMEYTSVSFRGWNLTNFTAFIARSGKHFGFSNGLKFNFIISHQAFSV